MNRHFADFQDFNSTASPILDRTFYPNGFFAPHYHANIEIIYVFKGSMLVTIDGQQNIVAAENFCMILPWQIHSFSTPEYSYSVVFVCPSKYITSFASQMSNSIGKPQTFKTEPEILHLFLNNLCFSDSVNENVNEYMISCILYGLCHSFISNCSIITDANRNYNQIWLKLIDYVSLHFRENLTLKDISNALGYNYHYVSHLFGQYFGMSFQSLRNLKRIDYARRELVSTNKSVTEIAYGCGFSSVRTFNRTFQDLMHMSPMEYRKSNARFDGSKELIFSNKWNGSE